MLQISYRRIQWTTTQEEAGRYFVPTAVLVAQELEWGKVLGRGAAPHRRVGVTCQRIRHNMRRVIARGRRRDGLWRQRQTVVHCRVATTRETPVK